MNKQAIAQREAARHVAAYLLRPSSPRSDVTLESRAETDAGVDPAEVDAVVAREAAAVRALSRALLEQGRLASREADLIVDVARGDATADDLRDYRVLTRQSRCGLG
jgi:hypothetical protein